MSPSTPPPSAAATAAAGDIAQLRAELAEVRAEQARLRERIAGVETLSVAHGETIERLDSRVDTLEAAIRRAEAYQTESMIELRGQSATLEGLKSSVAEVKSAVAVDTGERRRWTILGASIGAGSVYAAAEVLKTVARARGLLP